MRRWLVILTVALGAPAEARAADAGLLAESCGACHGTGGLSAGPSTPSLAGQPKEYFVAAMKGFQSGTRPSTVMAKLSLAYSDTEIEAMGAYFAARPPQPHAAEADKAVMKSGLKIAYKYCRTCHLDGSLWRQFHQYRAYDKECSKSCHLDYGPDKGEAVPLIGGQWAEYLAFQMADFRSGRRPMSPRKAKAVKALSGDEAAAVAQFYAGLQELKR